MIQNYLFILNLINNTMTQIITAQQHNKPMTNETTRIRTKLESLDSSSMLSSSGGKNTCFESELLIVVVVVVGGDGIAPVAASPFVALSFIKKKS